MTVHPLRNYVRLALTYTACALAFAPTILSAQLSSFQESWRWAHFTTESGLPSDQVYCIVETPAGTIWAGTERGLAWFDHFGWNAIDTTKGMPASQIAAIEPFGSDSILVVTGGKLYLGSRIGFTLLISENTGAKYIQSAVSNERNEIFLLGQEFLYRYKAGALEQINVPARPMSSGPRNLWRTESGKFWLNTIAGLYKGDGTKWSLAIRAERFEFTAVAVLENKRGTGLAAIALPREIQGLREWDRNVKPHLSSTERQGLQQTMDMSPSGDVIVIYQSGDIRVRVKRLWSSVEPPPMEFTSTHVVKFGGDGDLWVGTERGVFLFQTLSKRWTRWKHPFADPRNGVHEITRTSDGSIWLGTFQGLEIHRPNGRVEYIDNVLGTELGTVTAITEGSDHNVWIGSGSSFPGAFRLRNGSWKHFGVKEGLTAERIHKIRKDRQGRLWFLGLGRDYSDCSHQPGAFVLENGVFTHWGFKDSTHEGLISGRVYAFAEGPDGSRWFGTRGGLSRWKDGKWHHWTQTDGLLDQNERIYSIAIDSGGTVWFSNVGSGLGTVDRDDNVRFLTTAVGLVNNSIWDLKVDANGTLWISTERGLSSYNNGIWSSFTLQSGLSTPNIWDVLPTNGLIYVGSPGSGVNILDRSEAAQTPRVTFFKPSIEGTTALLRWTVFPYFGEVDPRDVEVRYRLDSMSWSNWTRKREISLDTLRSGSHSFEVQAKGLFGTVSLPGDRVSFHVEPHLYQRPTFLIPLIALLASLSVLGGAYLRRKRRYSKELKESDERFHLVASSTRDIIYDWNFVTNDVLSNDPRNPLLEIRQRGYTSAIESLMGYVHPEDRDHLHRSITGAVDRESSDWQAEYRFLNADGTYSHVLHRGHLMYDASGKIARAIGSIMDITERKQAEELSRSLSRRIIEAQESERRRVSRDLHDSVNQILASVKFRIESLQEQLPIRDKTVRRETQKAKLLLNKVMTEVRRISRNLRPAELDDLGLPSAVRSLAEEFSERTEIAVIVKDGWPKGKLSPEVSVALYRIIQEALTNVEKHAKAKRVRLGCTDTEDEIICRIEDNGLGIRTDEHGKGKIKGDGMGILDMKERLSYLGGTIEVASNPKRGTNVIVRIPIRKPSQRTES